MPTTGREKSFLPLTIATSWPTPIALNRCSKCGTATLFRLPRTGQWVDRSEMAVQALTERMPDLREAGDEIAERIAKLVNQSIIVGAVLADDTGEAIVPETVLPRVARPSGLV